MRKMKLFSVFAVLVLLLSATSGVVMAQEPTPEDQQSPSEPPRTATRVVERPDLPEDWKDWAIVQVKTQRYRSNGQLHVRRCVRYRQNSPHSNGDGVCPRAYSCTKTGQDVESCTDTAGSITAHQVGIADRYERVSQSWPTFFKVKHIYIWWTRSDPNSDVGSAESAVGYPYAMECNGDHISPHYPDHWFFDPTWLNDRHTNTYVWDMNWPRLYSDDDFGGWTETPSTRTETYW